MIHFVIIQYGARIVSSCFEKESDTIKIFFPWNDLFQVKIKFLIMLPWSIYKKNVYVFHGLFWMTWHVLQWFIVFLYKSQCQVSRCSLQVIHPWEHFQNGLETTAFWINMWYPIKGRLLWTGDSCSVLVKIWISPPDFLLYSSVHIWLKIWGNQSIIWSAYKGELDRFSHIKTGNKGLQLIWQRRWHQKEIPLL